MPLLASMVCVLSPVTKPSRESATPAKCASTASACAGGTSSSRRPLLSAKRNSKAECGESGSVTEAPSRPARDISAKATATRTRSRFYASGAAALLADVKEQLVTQTILDQAVPPGEAREQVEALLALVRGLGTLTLEDAYLPQEFRYDIRYRPGK